MSSSKSLFMHRIQSMFLVNTILGNLRVQKKFIRENISAHLDAAKKPNDGSIEENDLKKITGYYGLAVPAILGEAFAALRGKEMTDKERLASTCQGAMTGLFDDFFDEKRLSEEELIHFIMKPESYTGNSANEKLFLHFYTTALRNAPDVQRMQERLYQVYRAQVLSKSQVGSELSYEVIKDITMRKGAESLLFYRSAFENQFKKGEEKMLYCLGGLMQLSNDIFDVYKDQQQGIQTVVTTAWKIDNVRIYFSALQEIAYAAAYKTSYDPRNIQSFLDIISLGIFSRCYVCMDQLEKLEIRSGNVFAPQKYQRKDLICDMDTTKNKWRSLRYHLKHS